MSIIIKLVSTDSLRIDNTSFIVRDTFIDFSTIVPVAHAPWPHQVRFGMASAFDEPSIVRGYLITDSGNRISQQARILGPRNIVLNGKTTVEAGCVLRGDLRRSGGASAAGTSSTSSSAAAAGGTALVLGRYGHIGRDTILRPPGKCYKGSFNYYPVRIGDHVSIGERCVIEAAQVGHGVKVGDDCVIGKFTIIKDLAFVEPGSVVPPGTVIPSLTRWGGNPARLLGDLPETTQEMVEAEAKARYKRVKAVKE